MALRIVPIFLLVLLAGCSENPASPSGGSSSQAPAFVADLVLVANAVPASAGLGDSVEVSATISNTGSRKIYHGDGCSYFGGMTFVLFGPDGQPVRWRLTEPACPDFTTELGPSASRTGRIVFHGIVFTSEGVARKAAPGIYTAVITFLGWTAPNESDAFPLERRTQFEWTGL